MVRAAVVACSVPVERMIGIHHFQQWLASHDLPVPAPLSSRVTAQTVVQDDAGIWELAPWMPGVADYWTAPTVSKLFAALGMLAQVHVVASRMPKPDVVWLPAIGPSPGMQKRDDRLHRLLFTDIAPLRAAARRCPVADERALIDDALRLLELVVRGEVEKALRWRDQELPLQSCLRDVWHDHILFTGDEVTGVIDFGAIAFDSPACDIARLLGSLVGDDRERWRQGLEAYRAERPLTDGEEDAVEYFDTSGTVLSAANWVAWLWPQDNAAAPKIANRTAALKRLERLVDRLQVLAQMARSGRT